MNVSFLLGPILLIVAAAYASVGLGGGTAYLSLLSFWTTDPNTLRPMAWALNIVVTIIGVYNFRKEGYLDLSKIWHYLVGGVGGALIGARIPLSATTFRWLLAVTLAALAVHMFLSNNSNRSEQSAQSFGWPAKIALGFFPGVLSGLVGIGGGIVLGPIILSLGLLPIKRTAGLTALYILMVSTGALGMHFAQGNSLPWSNFLWLAILVLIGGFIGSKYGASKASPKTLKRIFGVIVLIAAVNLTIKAIFS
jgi:hypothetical protein